MCYYIETIFFITEPRIYEAIRHMSVRLYDVLDKVGASAEYRKLRQDCAISREIIYTLGYQLKQHLCSFYIFGSSSEGSTTPGMNSDTDVLVCHDKYPVIDNISDAGDGHSLLMIRDKHTKPGYVKLQRVYNGQPQTVYTRDIDRDGEESDSEGRICLTHVSELGKNKAVDERNGPADTSIMGNFDNVVGFRCLKIPEFSREWIGQKRQYKWPSKRMIDKMANMGCFVVGVGHPTSIERNIEWRLSFSLQERKMMFSMNIVQHKCYVVLKMIKK